MPWLQVALKDRKGCGRPHGENKLGSTQYAGQTNSSSNIYDMIHHVYKMKKKSWQVLNGILGWGTSVIHGDIQGDLLRLPPSPCTIIKWSAYYMYFIRWVLQAYTHTHTYAQYSALHLYYTLHAHIKGTVVKADQHTRIANTIISWSH